jgi:UDP-N-acetylmuramate: L-alanyl-gamma-D-glutamyl-meso-diaminopimelate ligase
MSGYAEQNLAHKPDLVVVGNAISRGNPEAEVVLERKLRYCSLPELVKEYFIRGKRSLVVAGTHGKTTTTSLLAWIFEHNGLNPSFLIGGLPNNFGQGARFTDSEWFIIEGDEYDTAFFDKRSKFVHYLPEVAIINNIEFKVPTGQLRDYDVHLPKDPRYTNVYSVYSRLGRRNDGFPTGDF